MGSPQCESSFHYYWLKNKISFKSKILDIERIDLASSNLLEVLNKFAPFHTKFVQHQDPNELHDNLEICSNEQNFHIQVSQGKEYAKVYINAEDTIFESLDNLLKEIFIPKNKSLSAQWLYYANGCLETRYTSIDVNNDASSEIYPFLHERNTTLDEYYDAFKNSSAKILLLMGERGTGKTSFLRGLLKHHQWETMISYDEKTLTDDETLMRFLDSSSDCFIIEDADTLLYKRENGNNNIHKFLNLGDGLITKSGKKLILTTNITSTKDIDSALIRPGRCFDVLHFNKLTPEQSKNLIASKDLDIPIPDKDVTIAELFNQQPIFFGNTLKKRVGFI